MEPCISCDGLGSVYTDDGEGDICQDCGGSGAVVVTDDHDGWYADPWYDVDSPLPDEDDEEE